MSRSAGSDGDDAVVAEAAEVDAPERFREVLQQYLAARVADGNDYVKSRNVARDLDCGVQRVASNMQTLAERGLLERWGSETYRITLPDMEGRDD